MQTHETPFRSSPRRAIAPVFCAFALASSAALAGALPAPTIAGHVLHRPGPIGVHGWGETDVDGDGRADLVTSADGPAASILVYGRLAGSSQLGLKQHLYGPADSIAALAAATGGETRVVTVSPGRLVTRYGGWPLAPIGSFSIAHDATLARIGDVDADGTLELLCAGGGSLSAYSLPDGTLEWSMSLAVTDLALASFDTDPALELLVAGGDAGTGWVLDGATRLADWSRPEGFGSYVAPGRFGNSLEAGFVAARDWTSLQGFTAAPYAPAWSMANSDTDGVAAGDTDADGRDEFAVGDGQWGDVRVYDAPTRQMLYEYRNPGHGMWALGMVDFDGDAREEVWHSARTENSSDYEDNFAAALMDPVNARSRLTIENYRQGATASLLADLDGDGGLEWATGTSSIFAYKGLLRILDADSQVEEWRAPYEIGNLFEPFQVGYVGLHAANLDADPAQEIVAVGVQGQDRFRFLVVDGATHAVQHMVPAPPTHWYGDVRASRLVQHVPGGVPELLIAKSNYLAAQNVTLHVYSLPQGQLLWSSPGVAGPYDYALQVDVGALDEDPAPEYLLVHTLGLTAFDSGDGRTEWTLPADVQGASIVATTGGPRIFAFKTAGAVTVYDPATRLAVGGFTLPAPLERLARLPGRDDLLLAVAGERLLLIDRDGAVLGTSGWIGGAAGKGDSLHVVADARGWTVSLGRSFATFQLRLADPDVVFRSGFERF